MSWLANIGIIIAIFFTAVVGGALGSGIGGYKGLDNCCHHDSEEEAVIADTTGVAGGFLLGGVIGHYVCDPIVEAPPPPPASAAVPATPPPAGAATASRTASEPSWQSAASDSISAADFSPLISPVQRAAQAR